MTSCDSIGITLIENLEFNTVQISTYEIKPLNVKSQPVKITENKVIKKYLLFNVYTQ